MLTGDQALTDFIRRRIRRFGSVSFAWFMEQALYHPEFGYYSSGRCAIGRRGDYFTNVSVGPLFGRLLAAQFEEMWESLGRPADFVIVEQGAHQGDFARDVLVAVRERAPDFFSTLRYGIIEPFPILRERQRETLRDFSKQLTWNESLADLEPFCGVHFSNELLDSMPVHLLSRAGDGWQERCVAELGDDFGFVSAGIGDAELLRRSQVIPRHSGEPYETEISLAALQWMEKLAPTLARGYVLTADYGYSRDEYYAPERRSGTLQCFSKHRILPSPLTEIGHADITAHVDWTSLAGWAETCGLSLAGFTDQHHFMTGVVTQLMSEQFGATADPATRRALQTLLHPEILGTTFQFLALTKNAPASVPLSGFKFARDPRAALGL
jgi:SAM-dependent MidA family methyltransferase